MDGKLLSIKLEITRQVRGRHVTTTAELPGPGSDYGYSQWGGSTEELGANADLLEAFEKAISEVEA